MSLNMSAPGSHTGQKSGWGPGFLGPVPCSALLGTSQARTTAACASLPTGFLFLLFMLSLENGSGWMWNVSPRLM